MEVLRRLLAACRPQRVLLALGVLFGLLNNFSGLLPSVLIQRAIDVAIPRSMPKCLWAWRSPSP